MIRNPFTRIYSARNEPLVPPTERAVYRENRLALAPLGVLDPSQRRRDCARIFGQAPAKVLDRGRSWRGEHVQLSQGRPRSASGGTRNAGPSGVIAQRSGPYSGTIARCMILVRTLVGDRSGCRDALRERGARARGAAGVMSAASSSSHSWPPHSLQSVPAKPVPASTAPRSRIGPDTRPSASSRSQNFRWNAPTRGRMPRRSVARRPTEPHEQVHVQRVDGGGHPARAQQLDDRARRGRVAPLVAEACRSVRGHAAPRELAGSSSAGRA